MDELAVKKENPVAISDSTKELIKHGVAREKTPRRVMQAATIFKNSVRSWWVS